MFGNSHNFPLQCGAASGMENCSRFTKFLLPFLQVVFEKLVPE